MAVPPTPEKAATGVASAIVHDTSQRPAARSGMPLRDVTACVDNSTGSAHVLGHAWAIARALRLPVSVLHVVETDGRDGPADPFEWELRRLEARRLLEEAIARLRAEPDGGIAVELRQGNAAEQILRWATAHEGELTVLCRHGRHGKAEWALSSTARKLVDSASGSLMVLASRTEAPSPVRYRRVLVPVDGSLRAESALAVATEIARAHDAELLLTHAIPMPELTQPGPPTNEDMDIERRCVAHNEHVGREYLRRLRRWLSGPDTGPRLHAARRRSARPAR